MQTYFNRRKAFTLLELLVVIAIMALLAAAIVANYSKAREAGWAARCKGNLKSLYQAALNYENDHGQAIPYAGPFELYASLSKTYENREGWVTWLPKSAPSVTKLWPDTVSHLKDVNEPTWYGSDATRSITNGTIWEYTNQQIGSYLCPKFKQRSVCGRTDAVRSYVMNSFFYCVDSRTNNASWDARNIQWNLGNLEPSRLIIFAEMHPQSTKYPIGARPDICQTYANNSGPRSADAEDWTSDGNDGVLDAGDDPGTDPAKIRKPYESIACIHNMSGVCRGHVVFLDGHVEAVGPVNINTYSSNGSNLTFVGCTGQY